MKLVRTITLLFCILFYNKGGAQDTLVTESYNYNSTEITSFTRAVNVDGHEIENIHISTDHVFINQKKWISSHHYSTTHLHLQVLIDRPTWPVIALGNDGEVSLMDTAGQAFPHPCPCLIRKTDTLDVKAILSCAFDTLKNKNSLVYLNARGLIDSTFDLLGNDTFLEEKRIYNSLGYILFRLQPGCIFTYEYDTLQRTQFEKVHYTNEEYEYITRYEYSNDSTFLYDDTCPNAELHTIEINGDSGIISEIYFSENGVEVTDYDQNQRPKSIQTFIDGKLVKTIKYEYFIKQNEEWTYVYSDDHLVRRKMKRTFIK